MDGGGDEIYTKEDLAFLKAASEVVKLHQHSIDPTIRDILNRLQYQQSPHGGFPISSQFIEETNNSNINEKIQVEEDHEIVHNQNLQTHQQLQYNDDFPQLSTDIFKTNEEVIDEHISNQNQRPPSIIPKVRYEELPRNYPCNICTLSFKRSSDLKRHEKIHLDVPPNVCPQCSKGFARKDALKRHINTLTCKRNRERLLTSSSSSRPH